jgi:hypothetical protein
MTVLDWLHSLLGHECLLFQCDERRTKKPCSPIELPYGTEWVRVRVRVSLRMVVYRQSVPLGAEPLYTHGQNYFSQLNSCCHNPYLTSSLTRGWVCHLQFLLALASAFILGYESRGTRDHILLSQIGHFPFYRLLRLAELRWRYSTPPPHEKIRMTDLTSRRTE